MAALYTHMAAMLTPPPLTRQRILDLVDAVEASDMAGPDRRAVIAILQAVATSKKAAAAIAPKGSAGAVQEQQISGGEERRQIHIALWIRIDPKGEKTVLDTHREITSLFKEYLKHQWNDQKSRLHAPPMGPARHDDLFWRLKRLSNCYGIYSYKTFVSLINDHRKGQLKSKRQRRNGTFSA